jgi:signal transduction histidine kinase
VPRPSLRSPSPRVVDALVFAIAGLPSAATAIATGFDKGQAAWGIVFGLLGTLPLLVRRRWPLAVLAAVVAAPVLCPVNLPFEPPLVVAAYTVGANRSWRVTLAACVAVVAVAVASTLAGGTQFGGNKTVGITMLTVLSAATGLYLGGKRTSILTLERERELLALRAVAEERVRIAQELHDVVGHNVSLIVVQAQALGATAGDPAIKAATDGIADLGRRTMAEMHRTLRLLRARDDAPDFSPQPGLDDLDGLLSRSRAAGLHVDLAVEGVRRELAQSIDLSAYRIVQEALTNVLKHAGSARTAVTIAYGAEALQLTIVDSGDGTPSGPATPGGHGLIGMRERTALFGGTLTAGPRPGEGFEVHASLPYDEGAA